MKKFGIFIAAMLAVQMLSPIPALAADYTPNPKTAYAASFIDACEGQTWFINEVERLLNREQRTLDTIASSADLDSIKSIGLKDRNITGSIPSAIGELKELRYLFLSGNNLIGTIPTSLYTLPKLQNIDLGGNKYAGAIPSEFGTMPALTTLILKDNAYTGTIPDSILNNTKIKVLNVMGNRLTGGIPSGITGMTGLAYLNLSGNALGGNIPDLSALTNLISLSMWDCGLTGTIPDSLYTLTSLQILDLSDNKLEGEVSTSIANLAALQYLALDTNSLRGLLPDVFTNTALTEIHLENNYLRGTVPASLKARDGAGAKVYLNNNYMTGSVLKGMGNNAGNFVDSANTEQYQLVSNRATVQISQTGAVNLYALLQNRSRMTGSTSKVLLRPDEYTVTCDHAKVEITSGPNGFYARALTEIPAAANLTVTIQIKDNAGSDYSTVKLKLTTDTIGSGGGSYSGHGADSTAVLHELYINGFADGKFHANDNITREQTAKMLIDALDKAVTAEVVATYPDVQTDRWSFVWVEAATREGYMRGYGNGEFGASRPITRAEMATVLARIAAKEGMTMRGAERTFSDVPDGQWYSEYIRQAVQYGLINGYGDGTFRPNQYITRAETVVMINRMLGRKFDTAAELHDMTCPFPDVSKDHWAYGDIMEAAITHNH